MIDILQFHCDFSYAYSLEMDELWSGVYLNRSIIREGKITFRNPISGEQYIINVIYNYYNIFI